MKIATDEKKLTVLPGRIVKKKKATSSKTPNTGTPKNMAEGQWRRSKYGEIKARSFSSTNT